MSDRYRQQAGPRLRTDDAVLLKTLAALKSHDRLLRPGSEVAVRVESAPADLIEQILKLLDRLSLARQAERRLNRFCAASAMNTNSAYSIRLRTPQPGPKEASSKSCIILATDATASKRMMSITIGLTFVAAAAPVAREPLPSCRCFLSLTRTTVCWRAVRHCGGAWWSTAPGKRQLDRPQQK
jgi:hypothetical protein